jgi:exodeoxyribonuclease-3
VRRAAGLTVCTLNLNGIRAAEKRGFSAWLTRRRPDVLCLQEVRALPEQVPPQLHAPAGYELRWNAAEKKGYAGVALFTRRPPRGWSLGSGLAWGDAEGRVLRADFEGFSAISLYVPSGSSGEERQQKKFEYLDHLLPWSRKLLRERRPMVLCGDVNIAHTELDIHAPKRNEKNSGFLPEERAWLTALLKQGWVDVLRALHPGVPGLYSWWSARGRAREKDLGWRLDYVLASPAMAELAEEAWIEREAGLSDHAPVWVRFRSPD